MARSLTNPEWLALLKTHRAIAVIRTESVAQGLAMAKAVAQGGGCLLEITWNSHRPAELVERLRADLPHCTIGCGTLLNQRDIQEAITAGVQFGFMPHVDAALIRYACDRGLPIHPGALTPTEIMAAWTAGATGVKVYPVSALGGSSYIRSLQGPLGQIPLIPTGGVNCNNALAFIQAGAIAVGLAGDLFPSEAIAQQNWPMITARTQQLLRILAP
ncbi:MAG: bifunctional 4-hydroxy-2-oxoglutarate aldolase/2-dehydro-3-deoxy-phosphogluconate aldolase [Thermosynechococcaceae cyanobacterium]